MFFVKTRKEDGSLNQIHVMKLKNKLGTKQLPTGELLLDGTEAELASEPGRGVASISNMLTITRIHNASASVSAMRRHNHLLYVYKLQFMNAYTP
jgi:alkylation response protein AidB-like acyl-CoA dehydrogenase